MPSRFRRPSPSMAISLIALFVALGGTSYAALSITGKNVKNNSLTTSDIRNGSLLKRDFRAGQLPRGAQGVPGAAGAAGRAGRDGFGVLAYPGEAADVGAVDTDPFFFNVACPAGTYPTGGDAVAQTNPPASDPVGPVLVPEVIDGQYFDIGADGRPNGWIVFFTNTSAQDITVFVDSICANAAPPTPFPVAKADRFRAMKTHARAVR